MPKKPSKPHKKRKLSVYDVGISADTVGNVVVGDILVAWVEDISERGKNWKVFRDPALPGKVQQVFTIHDQHYRDGDAWQDVDESIVDDGVDGFAKRCDKTRHVFRIGTGGQQRWYPRRDVPTEYIGIINIQFWRTTGGGSWRNLNLPAAVWKQQGAEWDLTNLYASITNTWHKIKSDFILKDSTAPTRLRFEVELVGLTLNPETWELTSITDGLVWGHINPPVAWYGNPTQIRGTPLPITSTFDGTYIEWGVDTTGATFPVYVDPTFTDGFGGDVQTYNDVLLYEPTPTTNYGTYGVTEIGTEPSGPGKRERYLFKFDVSSLAGNTVTDAKLYIYRNGAGGAVVDNPVINLYSILSGNSNWTEAGACWSYRVGTTAWAGSAGCGTQGTDYSNTLLGTVTPPTPYEDLVIDLDNNEVQNWIDVANYGLLAKEATEPNTERRIYQYGSSDEASAYRPKLVVEYVKYVSDTGTGTDAIFVRGKGQIEQEFAYVEYTDSSRQVSQEFAYIEYKNESRETSQLFTYIEYIISEAQTISMSDVGTGIDSQTLAALLGLPESALGGDFLDLSVSLSTADSGSGSDEVVVSIAIIGSTVWGHITGVQETNIRTFVGNWTGTGQAEGSGDNERLRLCSGEFMISEIVETGVIEVTLLQNNYAAGDTVLLQYRHGATEAACLAASWNNYTVPFMSLGYVQVRVEATV